MTPSPDATPHPPAAHAHPPATGRDKAAGLLLLLAVFLTYLPALGHGFVGLDDYDYVAGNPWVLKGLNPESVAWAFTRVWSANWHPLTWLSHMLDVELYGLQPLGHHLTNILLHAANALLFFLFLRESTGAFGRSLAAAALFALHPLHVESVAWVSERKDVLSALFWLLTMLAYARWTRSRRPAAYLAALACLGLGLMAKPMLVTLPFALLLLDWWPLARRNDFRLVLGLPVPRARLWLEKTPFFALALASALATYLIQMGSGAGSSFDHLGLGWRLANAVVAYATYLGKTFWPAGLAPFYPHPGTGLSLWLAGGCAMLLLACTAAALWRTRRQPYLAAGWLWFLGVLVPVIGIVQVGGQAWADRYSYIPHLGLLAALVWLGGDLAGGLRLPRPSRRAAAAALAVLLLVLGGLSARQATFWKDSQTLFQRALDVTQGNYMAHYMLSVYANEQGDDAAFVRHYTAAAALHPRYVADAHVRKGYETAVNGRYQAAMFHFVQALELDPDNARALSNLGMLHAASGRLDDAVALLRRAVEAKPGAEALQENLERLLRLRRERKTHTEAAQ